jgi:hypothetical protein
MSYVIRQIHPPGKSATADEATAVALTLATVRGDIERGKYLEWSDPDARGGLGDDGWTDDVDKAKRFASFTAAMECWKAQSAVHPIRWSDGKPNRPLTAYSVTVEQVDD